MGLDKIIADGGLVPGPGVMVVDEDDDELHEVTNRVRETIWPCFMTCFETNTV